MREIVVYVSVALSSLFILGYSVHMFVGGLVSPAAEITIISVACIAGSGILAFMGWDIVKQRRRR